MYADFGKTTKSIINEFASVPQYMKIDTHENK